ncbi:MAG: hypothetical protein ACRC1K_08080 [Planctomycetia bacterium]
MPSIAESFRRQAQSDSNAYFVLAATSLPACHRLHFLQMWLEKLCKAYLWGSESQENDDLRSRHQVVGPVLPRLIVERWRLLDVFSERPDMKSLRSLCRDVDLLHPQIDQGGRRQDNVEYPWTVQGRSFVPTEYEFPLNRRLHQKSGMVPLKATVQLTRDPRLLDIT